MLILDQREHYRLFKSLIEPERYMSSPFLYRFKHCLSNFRCSGHQLRIGNGRHMKTDRSLYPPCLPRNVYCIENTFHFLLVCPVYADIKERHFIYGWLRNYITEHLFVQIMSDTNKNLFLHLLDN